MRELRPRGGCSQYRSFYKRTGPNQFVIGAIGPEVQVDPRGFRRSVEAAEERLSKYEGYGGQLIMIITGLKIEEESLAEDLKDPEFRKEWEGQR